jgi:ADP-ribose pyrophosphatase YjhB (NUDIX family)
MGMFHIIGRLLLTLVIGGRISLLLLWASLSTSTIMATANERIHVAKQAAAFTSFFSCVVTAPATIRSRRVITSSFWGVERKRSQGTIKTACNTRRTMSLSSSSSISTVVPRAAVSVVVQCLCKRNDKTNKNDNESDDCDDSTDCYYYYYYLLVQRGKEPNRGKWSLPGGKIEPGETTLQGAIRELGEETKWPPPPETEMLNAITTTNDLAATGGWERSSLLRWYPMPITVSDSIGAGFHYVIAQCFAELSVPTLQSSATTTTTTSSSRASSFISSWPPPLLAADDAVGADWFTWSEIHNMEQEGRVTPGVSRVVARAKELSRHGLLPTEPALQLP